MELKKLTLLFALCILVRLGLVYFISRLSGEWLKYSSAIGFAIAIGFTVMIIIDRKMGAFGQKVWWSNYRYIHVILYLTFAIMAFNKNKLSYVPILVDTILGLLFFIKHRYIT